MRTLAQPLPSVEPALLLADLLDELEDRVCPALESADFDGLPILLTSSLRTTMVTRSPDKTAPAEEGYRPPATGQLPVSGSDDAVAASGRSWDLRGCGQVPGLGLTQIHRLTRCLLSW
jgi:hypothetical protein